MYIKQPKSLILMGLLSILLVVLLILPSGNQSPTRVQAQAEATFTPTAENIPTEPPFFSGERALENAAFILDYSPRQTGSENIEALANAMTERLKDANWEVSFQEFYHEAEGVIYPVRNIIAQRGTEGPIILLGSHYDSRIWADNDTDIDRRQEPVLGANDGASSTAVLLEMAEIIDQHYDVNQRVWLVFFDAEDNGRIPGWDWILGSRYMAQNLELIDISPTDIQLMILLDMVGEADADDSSGDDGLFWTSEQIFRMEGYSFTNAPQQTAAIWQVAADLGYEDVFVPEVRGNVIDDHLGFIEQGIPAVDIIDLDYPFWHTTQDTLDKLSAVSLSRVGQVVEIYLLQTNTLQVKNK